MALVSVIIPAYNHGKYIEEAIQSVLRQTFQDFEIIISDDCSTDDTGEKLREYQNDPRIRVYYQKEKLGPTEQIHFLVSKADSKYIALVNSDDVWLPTKLEKQVSFMEKNDDVELCFTLASMITDKGNELSLKSFFAAEVFIQENRTQAEWIRFFFDNGNCLCHPSLLARKGKYGNVFRFNPSYRQTPDFEVWSRMILSCKIWIIQEKLTLHRRHEIVENTSAATRKNTERLYREMALIKYHMIDAVSDDLFIEAFSDVLKDPETQDHDEVNCEKYFVLREYKPVNEFMNALAIEFYFNHAANSRFVSRMRSKYHFEEKDFYEMTAQPLNLPLVSVSELSREKKKICDGKDKADNRETIPIMQCFDNNYVIPAAVSMYSMLSYADKKYFYKLYVLHTDITYQNQIRLAEIVSSFDNAELEFVNMEGLFSDVWEMMPNTDHLSREVLYKLVTPELFPQYDKMIITDVDVVFLGDISPSWHVIDSDSQVLFAGVHHISPEKTFLREYYESTYPSICGAGSQNQLKICGGYLVENLKALRESKMQEVFIDYLKENSDRLLQAEQDVINFCVRQSQIVFLPLNYVVCSYQYELCANNLAVATSDPFYTYQEMMDAIDHPIQLHYATKTKPWNDPTSTKADIWYEFLRKTTFEKDFWHRFVARDERFKEGAYPGREILCEKLSPSKVKVSVVVCCYNQESTIEKTLRLILNQETKFDYEVIVADDGSSDRSQFIIASIVEEYPQKVKKCLLRDKNVGISQNYYEAFSMVEGEYVAVCDGDDYWIDKRKLQKQVDVLERDKNCYVVCSDFIVHDVSNNGTADERFNVLNFINKSGGERKTFYTYRDLIMYRFIASCTVMYRWLFRDKLPEFLKNYTVYDFPLSVLHATCGTIRIISEPLSQYNVFKESLSHSNTSIIPEQTLAELQEINQLIDYKIEKTVQEYCNIALGKNGTEKLKPSIDIAVKDNSVIDTRSPIRRAMENAYALHAPLWFKKIYKSIKKLFVPSISNN